jgi:hypothetical protein
MPRRKFLARSLAATAATGIGSAVAAAPGSAKTVQEFYELRIYRNTDEKKQAIVENYLKRTLLPALGRLEINRVGVFSAHEPTKQDASIYMLIPYRTLDVLAGLNSALAADAKAAADFFASPVKDPPYTRIESRLMKAFEGMPVIELSSASKSKKKRMFELRIYQSHNGDAARRKVEMFNEGEIELMRKVNLSPVFFGETLISDDVPNLTYMLSANDLEAHKQHFKAFLAHPEWAQMKKIKKFQGTVSKITSVMLAPTKYSQI